MLVVLQDKKGKQFFPKVFMNATPQYIAAYDPEQKLPHGEYVVTASVNNKISSKTGKSKIERDLSLESRSLNSILKFIQSFQKGIFFSSRNFNLRSVAHNCISTIYF